MNQVKAILVVAAVVVSAAIKVADAINDVSGSIQSTK